MSRRTKRAFEDGLRQACATLDESVEREKLTNDFLTGVPRIVEAIRAGQIPCRISR